MDWDLTPRKSKGQDALRLSPWESNGYLKFVTVETTSMQTFFNKYYKCIFFLHYDVFLNDIFFFPAYFVVEIQYVISITYTNNMLINCLYSR